MMEVKPLCREITSIQLTRETKARLAGFGKKGETYEQIILCLIKGKTPKKVGELPGRKTHT